LGQPGDVRREAQLAESPDVVPDGDAVLGAGDQGAVHGLGQALPGPPLRYRDALKPRVSHLSLHRQPIMSLSEETLRQASREPQPVCAFMTAESRQRYPLTNYRD